MCETMKVDAGFTCAQLIVAHICHKLFVTLTNRVTPFPSLPPPPCTPISALNNRRKSLKMLHKFL